MIESYGKVYTFGTRQVAHILTAPVYVQEKVDGSQIGFGVFGGELRIRSRGGPIDLANPDKQFKAAVEYIQLVSGRLLHDHTYRGECVTKPRHNKQAYERTPHGFVALFDVEAPSGPLSVDSVTAEAFRLGFECVPLVASGVLTRADLMESGPSFLGGEREGIVIKSTTFRDANAPNAPLKAKIVTDDFKERITGRKVSPKTDPVDAIAAEFNTEARMEKAVQHLRESGRLVNDTQDIGLLLREFSRDLEEEAADEVKEALWQAYRKRFLKNAAAGLPQWYKERLANSGA